MIRVVSILCVLLALVSCEAPKAHLASMRVTQPLMLPVSYKGQEDYLVARQWKCRGHKIPKGLVVDGASVPRIFWTFMPPDGLHRAAALFHDWLYLNRGILPDGFIYTRADADCAFRDIMVECGVGERRAWIAYEGVRVGGWAVWNKPKPDLVILPVPRTVSPVTIKHRTVLSHIFDP